MPLTEFPCSQCGGRMAFDPSALAVTCPYCGHANAVPQAPTLIAEQDYLSALHQAAAEDLTIERLLVRCSACGAETTLRDNATADVCPFCGSGIVASSYSARQIKPKALLPFSVTREQAYSSFQCWIKSLWFAPNALKKYAQTELHRLKGLYLPYWTYDADTETDYVGERGEHYYVTESYTTTENGRPVTRTRQVQRTRWYPARGHVSNRFDDVLVLASHSLPEKSTMQLEPWDLKHLVPYDDQYLGGFQVESYRVPLEDGFTKAQGIMEVDIRSSIRRDIGGDEQRIHNMDTQYDHITYKHILLPIWVSAYRYREKTYHFLINGRTGEVQGERPWSWIKITLAILLGLAILAVIFYFVALQGPGATSAPGTGSFDVRIQL